MRDTTLMQLALGLVPPWLVKNCAFDADKRRLDIEIDRHALPRYSTTVEEIQEVINLAVGGANIMYTVEGR